MGCDIKFRDDVSASTRRVNIQIIVTGLIVAACLLLPAVYNYSKNEVLEEGDLAANALQVINCKQLKEIYGNYSRWGFHHPGPAHFYVYAASELLLYDLTGLSASPHGAHVLGGGLLKIFFFLSAIYIFAQWVERDSFIPLSLLFLSIHFFFVGKPFYSIWAPEVPLFPFMCFLAACASIACGRGSHMALGILAGAFLIHGHVSHIMFVVPLFLLAYFGLIFNHRSQAGSLLSETLRRWPYQYLVGTLIIAVFMLPIMIDLLQVQKNFVAILQHLKGHIGERKGVLQSTLYFLSYFAYCVDTHYYFDEVRSESFLWFFNKWYFFVIWLGIIVVGFWMWIFERRGRQFVSTSFTGSVYIFWAGSTILSLIWGTIIDGELFSFNSYFNYAILSLPLMVLAVGIANKLPTGKIDFMVVTFYLLAVVMLLMSSISFNVFNPTSSDTEKQIRSAVQACIEKHLTTEKIFLFFDRHSDWSTVVSVALDLKRMGINFCVMPEWGFIFGKNNVCKFGDTQNITLKLYHGLGIEDRCRINQKLGLILGCGRIDPRGGEIRFGENGNYTTHCMIGLSDTDQSYAKSNSKDVVIRFYPVFSTTDVIIRINAKPFLVPGKVDQQRMELSLNSHLLGRTILRKEEVVSFKIDKEVWNNRGKEGVLCLRFPDAVTPLQLGLSNDNTTRACAINKIEILEDVR